MHIINYEILKDLCLEYGFKKPDLIGGYFVSIKSKNDTWYVPNLKYYEGKTNIKLLHANKRGGAGYHYQGKFKNYKEMFEYIKGHDDKISFSYNKMFDISNILKYLEVCNHE